MKRLRYLFSNYLYIILLMFVTVFLSTSFLLVKPLFPSLAQYLKSQQIIILYQTLQHHKNNRNQVCLHCHFYRNSLFLHLKIIILQVLFLLIIQPLIIHIQTIHHQTAHMQLLKPIPHQPVKSREKPSQATLQHLKVQLLMFRRIQTSLL